jgi:hypothetical protein
VPVKIQKENDGKGYRTSTPGGVKGRHMTKRDAEAQRRLLNAIDHGWEPDNRRKKGE